MQPPKIFISNMNAAGTILLKRFAEPGITSPLSTGLWGTFEDVKGIATGYKLNKLAKELAYF